GLVFGIAVHPSSGACAASPQDSAKTGEFHHAPLAAEQVLGLGSVGELRAVGRRGSVAVRTRIAAEHGWRSPGPGVRSVGPSGRSVQRMAVSLGAGEREYERLVHQLDARAKDTEVARAV